MWEFAKSGSGAVTYRAERARESVSLQRRLLLAGGVFYGVATLWLSFRLGTDPAFATISFGLLIITALLYGLTYLGEPRIRLEIIPALFALAYSAHIILGIAYASVGGALRFGALFSLLGAFLLLLAPTWRGLAISLGLTLAVGAYGAGLFLPMDGRFSAGEAFAYWLPGLVVVAAIGAALENARRETFELKVELQRRATSDEVTGVSNQAHINLLAQNEFSRARRYGEPYACLMLEIDAFDDIKNTWGSGACDVVVQLLAGYCVVVMRHCDSFGRLSRHRFLALLPETRGLGALTLASRMCQDVSVLDVMVEGKKLNFTVSIGAAELHAVDRAAPDLLRRTAQALDDAIEHGRGRAVLAAGPSMPAQEPSDLAEMAS